MNLEIKVIDNVETSCLNHYIRTQVVSRHYYIDGGVKKEREISFVDDWSQEDRINIVKKYFLSKNFYAAGIFNQGEIIAFYVIGSELLKGNQDYIELKHLQVSLDYRGKGLGKRLFQDACLKAKERNASKLYISAHSAVETQLAYEKLGCVAAKWKNQAAIDAEPYDIQMEYKLV
jgi:GNAT superfamily N-acetyltransferase